MQKLEFELADGWTEVVPRSDAPSLLVEDSGRLLHLNSDLSLRHDFGEVGPVECPIAYDPIGRRAYRYVCAKGFARKDFSELRVYDLDQRSADKVMSLPLNRWILWQLECIASQQGEAGQLFGLIATDRPTKGRVVIEHQLFALKPGETRYALRPLCRDAYRPLAFSRSRRQMIFSGAEGIYLVGLNGRRLLSASVPEVNGDGACFAPDGLARALISSEGLYLWNLDYNRCERVVRSGHYPQWSADGAGFWFRRSSADLFYYDFTSKESSQLLAVKNQRNAELWNARAAVQSPCGRFLAVGMTGKRLKGVTRKRDAKGEVERVYAMEHRIVILDLQARVLWHARGQANQLTWVT